jgi:hypothetical protein
MFYKIILVLLMSVVLNANAHAYFDGGASVTTGPDGYRGTDIYLIIGGNNLWLKPSMSSYTSDYLDKTYRTYKVRGGFEANMYTLAGEAGMTPEVNAYSNKFFGADLTVSLTPGEGGKSRLAGPSARAGSRGGQGVTRIDVGAGLKHSIHTIDVTGSEGETGQTEYSLFAGAKILSAQLGASFTGYRYDEENVLPLVVIPGHNFILYAYPKSSVNARLDITGYPMVTPFVSYTTTKYKNNIDDSSAYLFGAYIDLNMIEAHIGYQIFDNGSEKDNFISIGAGIRF